MDALQPVAPLDVVALLPGERHALLDLLSGLEPAAWEAPTECPAWSVKGIALHVLGDDLSLLSRQRDEATNGLLLYAADHPGLDFKALLDGFNERWVTAAGFLSTRLVLSLLELSGDLTAEYYAAVDPLAPGEQVRFFGSTGPSPFWQAIAREYAERWLHQQQVRRAVGAPDLGGEHLVTAARVVLLGLAAHLHDLGASAGDTLAFVIPDVGRWTLRRGDDGWELLEGGDPVAATAALTLHPGRAAPALSRGLDRADVPGVLTAGGDPVLAAAAVTGCAVLLARPPG
ncbi:MAG TPA: maleylpyruvate isomerase N-terminal domain-containing protein [Acidimicrobiales bacterium]|nr:maleylpyruvate isomerase N-terminal domain-containing protein [Acidimicrobiales bacterium]